MSMSSKGYNLPTWQQFATKCVLSAAAATVAETATYPLDLCKTRLQLQGESALIKFNGGTSHKPQRKGMLKMCKSIVVHEGFFNLWKGLSPALYRHFVYTTARMVSYEVLRDNITKATDGNFHVWHSAICGVTAGGFGQFLASPTDLVKVQIQMEGKRQLEGYPAKYKGAMHAFSVIYKQRGFLGLWGGWAPNVQRAALVNMGDLTTYDSVKHYLLRNTSLVDNWVTHFFASCCSGMVAAILSSPADVIKARIMNQPHDDVGRPLVYKSSLDCLVQTVKNEGFFALYKGFLPCYIRMAPWSLCFWISYEEIRRICGVRSF